MIRLALRRHFDNVSKGPLTAAAPQQQHLAPIFTAQLSCTLDQQAEDHHAIVIGKIDQLRFDHEPAELDQLTGSLAPLHLPFPLIITVAPEVQTVALRRHSP